MPVAPYNPIVEVLVESADSTILRKGNTVFKVHAADTVESELRARLRIAEGASDVLLAPLGLDKRGDRLVSSWPFAEPLAQDAPIPWERAGAMLAQLHRIDVPSDLPEGGGPRRMLRAVRLLREAPPSRERTTVLEAFATLPPRARQQSSMRRLIHGDFHLGQLVCVNGIGWRLIDVDELGLGDPVWDLARPAAWFACGFLPDEAWHCFLSSYLSHAGPGVDASDPWLALDVPARALVVQSAARAVEKAQRAGKPYDPAERALIEACDRIVRAPHGEPTR